MAVPSTNSPIEQAISTAPALPSFTNRIVGYRPAVNPNELTPNPQNPRVHPQAQREAIRGVLSEVGWVGTAIYNVRTGRLIDGHERQQEAIEHQQTIPVLDVDLSEDEERLIIATFDPLTALASYDATTLSNLLEEVSTGSEAVATLLADMQQRIDLLDSAASDASTFSNQGQSHMGGDRQIERATIVRIAMHVASVRRIELALARAIVLQHQQHSTRIDRGEALSEIVEQYLQHTPSVEAEAESSDSEQSA